MNAHVRTVAVKTDNFSEGNYRPKSASNNVKSHFVDNLFPLKRALFSMADFGSKIALCCGSGVCNTEKFNKTAPDTCRKTETTKAVNKFFCVRKLPPDPLQGGNGCSKNAGPGNHPFAWRNS
jgi:hypothetical protein